MDIKSLVPGSTKANVNKSDKAKKKTASESADAESSDSGDSVSLTGQASQISKLIGQMKASPVVDPSRVSPVKNKIDNDEYVIEYERVANKMLDFESRYQGYGKY